jgi:hypothetical protein
MAKQILKVGTKNSKVTGTTPVFLFGLIVPCCQIENTSYIRIILFQRIQQ